MSGYGSGRPYVGNGSLPGGGITAQQFAALSIALDTERKARIAAEAALPGTYVPQGEYTIAVIPDTQFLSQDYPAHFAAIATYLAANKTALNLGLILHVGDVVDDGIAGQYNAADAPMAALRDIGVPFLATIGNHDYDGSSGGNPDHTLTTLWNAHFGTAFYATAAAVPVLKDASKTEYCYISTTLGGRPTLVFALEHFPRAAVMTWADTVVAAFPNHDIIVNTHAYLYGDGTRTNWATPNGPSGYTDAASGDDMWREHFSHWRNFIGVFSGHHLIPGNLAHRFDYGSGGNAALQQFSNWQQSTEGGQGRIVLLTINPVTRSARRRVYNAALAAFDTTTGYDRTLPMGRGAQAPGAQVNATARSLYLPGVTGEYASCADSVALRTANAELIADITPVDWTPGASARFVVGKWSVATQKSYFLAIDTTGALSFLYSLDGTTTNTVVSDAVVPFADGERGRIRARRIASTGSITFETARPGEPWTQLGSVRPSTVGALFASTSVPVVGDLLYAGGVWAFNGQVHSAEIRDALTHAPLASVRFDVPFPSRYRDDQGNLWSLTGTTHAWQPASLVNV
jgi:hypothetical protein